MRSLLQFTLDLFDPPAAVPAPLQETRTPAAPTMVLPLQTLEQALSPVTFRHPQASREILLDGCLVAYAFKRSRRRTIGFSVGVDGLSVSAPAWAPLRDVEAALREKSGWIVRKLGEMRERGSRMEAARIEWADGVVLPFFGQPLQVVLAPDHAFARSGVELQQTAGPDGTTRLLVGLAHGVEPSRIRDLVQAWLMREARTNFTERLDRFAPQLGVQWRSLRLSSANTRWGSASADGSIRLNWRLVHMRQPIIDYVVVHELAHLRVMDHSPQFWGTVGTVMPDYADLRGQLKSETVPRW